MLIVKVRVILLSLEPIRIHVVVICKVYELALVVELASALEAAHCFLFRLLRRKAVRNNL